MKRSLIATNSIAKPQNNSMGKDGLEKLLKVHFGHSGFRGKQLEAIEAVLSGRDCFCLMPTGGGKSMCYQIPALASSGIVLVISPLIALMENQVTLLKSKGVHAEFLSSTQTTRTKEKIHEDLNSGKPSVKLLYVTPELVVTSVFTTKLVMLYNRGLLSLIAVDEAHCISKWGHDFRPSYRKLSSLRGHLSNVPIIALTATAIPKVQKDVIESLQLQNPLILRASFNRPNIYYEVRFKDLLNDVYADLRDVLKSSGEVCSIIYCLERSTCDYLSSLLMKNGIASAAYHAGLNSKIRSTILDDWLSSRIPVIVATVAFGMGIDRRDVRVVCHFNIPRSMEAFYQESGRAGRDQQPARSVLYYGLDDRKRMEFILSNAVHKKSQSSTSSDELLKNALSDFKEMVDYCESSDCRRKRILQNFGEQASVSLCQKSCDACKHQFLLSTQLAELKRIGSISKKGGLAPVFQQRVIETASENSASEFWNREEEVNYGEEISESEDESVVIKGLARSQLSSKLGLDEKFEALQRAEEIYFKNKGQNMQIAATVRWLSSASYEQISERLSKHCSSVDADSKQEMQVNAATTSPSPAYPKHVSEVQVGPFEDDFLGKHLCESAVEVSRGKIHLPPIPSFSDFVKQKAKGQVTSATLEVSCSGSGSAQKNMIETEKNQGKHVLKKIKHL